MELNISIKESSCFYKYSSDESANIGTFTANPGYTFSLVKQKKGSLNCFGTDILIWESKDKDDLANKVVVDETATNVKKLTIHFISGQCKYFYKEKKKYYWNRNIWFENKSMKKSPSLDKSEHPSHITILTRDDLSQEPHDSSQKNLNLNDFTKFDFYKYLIGDFTVSFEYEFKNEAKCVELRFDDRTVWRYDERSDSGYPKTLYFNTGTKTFFVSLKDDLLYIYRYSFDWRPLFFGKPKPIELDIGKRESNDNYDYFKNKDSNTAFYIAKGNYVFNAVKKPIGFRFLRLTNYFWEAKDYLEYANKVVVDGVGALKSLNNVSIHLLNGDVKHFCKPGRFRAWMKGVPTTSSDSISTLNGTLSKTLSEHSPDYIKIITQDEFNHNKCKENDITKYDVLEYYFKKDSGSAYSLNEPYAYEYYFMNCAKCLEIRFLDKTVWKYDPKENKNNFPKRINFNLKEVKVSIYLSSIWYYKYERRDDEWNLVDKSTPGPIELDVKSMKSHPQFDYYKNDTTKTFIYTAKEGWSFNKVKQDDKEIWDTTDPNLHLDKVSVKNVDTPEQEVTLHMVNGNTKKFKLDKDGQFIVDDTSNE